MGPERRVEIRLEVDSGSEPIRGLIDHRRGGRSDFCGWLQLIAAVEAARSAPEDGDRPTIGAEGSGDDPQGD